MLSLSEFAALVTDAVSLFTQLLCFTEGLAIVRDFYSSQVSSLNAVSLVIVYLTVGEEVTPLALILTFQQPVISPFICARAACGCCALLF